MAARCPSLPIRNNIQFDQVRFGCYRQNRGDVYLLQVSSKANLTRDTFFYDTTTNLLWVHLESDYMGHYYFFGIPFADPRASVTVRATCPGGNCQQSVNVGAISGSAPSGPVADLCETSGGIAKGITAYTPRGSPSRKYLCGFSPQKSLRHL